VQGHARAYPGATEDEDDDVQGHSRRHP
jgi:hypothetical protein